MFRSTSYLCKKQYFLSYKQLYYLKLVEYGKGGKRINMGKTLIGLHEGDKTTGWKVQNIGERRVNMAKYRLSFIKGIEKMMEGAKYGLLST